MPDLWKMCESVENFVPKELPRIATITKPSGYLAPLDAAIRRGFLNPGLLVGARALSATLAKHSGLNPST
jgi:hypothetical protein